MTDFSIPVGFNDLAGQTAATLLDNVRSFCGSGRHIHPDSLKAVVLKLTYFSRDMKVSQQERDEAADLATGLANAALKTYGQTSEYGMELVNSIRMIMNQPVAA